MVPPWYEVWLASLLLLDAIGGDTVVSLESRETPNNHANYGKLSLCNCAQPIRVANELSKTDVLLILL